MNSTAKAQTADSTSDKFSRGRSRLRIVFSVLGVFTIFCITVCLVVWFVPIPFINRFQHTLPDLLDDTPKAQEALETYLLNARSWEPGTYEIDGIAPVFRTSQEGMHPLEAILDRCPYYSGVFYAEVLKDGETVNVQVDPDLVDDEYELSRFYGCDDFSSEEDEALIASYFREFAEERGVYPEGVTVILGTGNAPSGKPYTFPYAKLQDCPFSFACRKWSITDEASPVCPERSFVVFFQFENEAQVPDDFGNALRGTLRKWNMQNFVDFYAVSNAESVDLEAGKEAWGENVVLL